MCRIGPSRCSRLPRYRRRLRNLHPRRYRSWSSYCCPLSFRNCRWKTSFPARNPHSSYPNSVASAIAACPGAPTRVAVLNGSSGHSRPRRRPEGDQGIGQDVHHRLPGSKAAISTNWSHPANPPFIDHSNEVWNFGRKSSAFRERSTNEEVASGSRCRRHPGPDRGCAGPCTARRRGRRRSRDHRGRDRRWRAGFPVYYGPGPGYGYGPGYAPGYYRPVTTRRAPATSPTTITAMAVSGRSSASGTATPGASAWSESVAKAR